jgi:hypothetical protein
MMIALVVVVSVAPAGERGLSNGEKEEEGRR